VIVPRPVGRKWAEASLLPNSFPRANSCGTAFVDVVARKNVELTMAQILKESEILRDMQSKKTIKVAEAMYNRETAKVDFL
jgi:hypothetical protein